MKFIFALDALLAGKKVFKPEWPNICYIVIEKNTGRIIDESREKYILSKEDFDCDSWLIYDEQEAKPITDNLTFGEAIEHLKRGKRITRACWHNETIYLYYQASSGTQLEEIRVRTVTGFFAPWHANHSELLADDWRVIVEDA